MDEYLYDVEEELYGDDEDYAEFRCPECGETICLDEEDFCKDTVVCPSCGHEIFLDECEECDCECSEDDETKDNSRKISSKADARRRPLSVFGENKPDCAFVIIAAVLYALKTALFTIQKS